jgi:hypothetical protein
VKAKRMSAIDDTYVFTLMGGQVETHPLLFFYEVMDHQSYCRLTRKPENSFLRDEQLQPDAAKCKRTGKQECRQRCN